MRLPRWMRELLGLDARGRVLPEGIVAETLYAPALRTPGLAWYLAAPVPAPCTDRARLN